MTPSKKALFAGTAVVVPVAIALAAWLYTKAAPLATDYVAKYLCSSTFVSDRDPQKVFAEDVMPVNPLAKTVAYRIDRGKKTVTATSLGRFPMTAMYRRGCGCSLVIGTTAEKMRDQQLDPPDINTGTHSPPDNLPWPEGNQGPIEPSGLGIDKQVLEMAVDRAFAEPHTANPRKTRAVVIVYNGKLVAERYAPGFHKGMPLLGWSMAKSVVNALVGILVMEGRLDIMKPASVPEWRNAGDPRGRITMDQLLRMSSGLAFDEVYAPWHDVTCMLFGSYDFGAYAATCPLETRPGTRWSYSSGTANIIARIVRQTLEEESTYYYGLIRDKLFDRIGMTSAFFEPDSSGTIVGSSYVFATPRDWAKFGLLYLNDGIWAGERVLPEGWVAYTTTPAPSAPRGEYGALFWLNRGAIGNPADRRWPHAPVDAFAAEGFQEQKVIVIPSKKLVVVRFGATTDRKSWGTDAFIKDVLKALPSSS